MPPRYYPNPYDPYNQYSYYPPYNGAQQPVQPQNNQPTQQPVQQPVQQPQQPAQPQIQNGGFVSVRSEQEARNYPVAPGTSITFKDENAPYCYTKTKGFSALEEPLFEIYRLVKEGSREESTQPMEPVIHEEYALKSDLKSLMDTVDAISDEIELLQKRLDRKKEESRHVDS